MSVSTTEMAPQKRPQKGHGVSGHLPLKPHLLTFLRLKERLEPGEALSAPGKSLPAMYLDSLLTNKGALRDDKRDVVGEKYSAKLPFTLTDSRATWGDVFITPSRVIRFNSFLEQWLLQTLMDYVIASVEEGMTEKESIYKFIHRYELWDLNFEALKKASTRYRAAKKLPVFKRKSKKKSVFA